MNDPIKQQHWQTQRLVEVLAALAIGDTVSYGKLAERCDIPVKTVKNRLQSAKAITLRDHHVIIETVRGEGIVRIGQQDVTAPVARQRNKARRAAGKGQDLISDGVTDWNALPNETKVQLHTESAVLGTIRLVTDHTTRRRLTESVRVVNGEQSLGRTLDLLRGEIK